MTQIQMLTPYFVDTHTMMPSQRSNSLSIIPLLLLLLLTFCCHERAIAWMMTGGSGSTRTRPRLTTTRHSTHRQEEESAPTAAPLSQVKEVVVLVKKPMGIVLEDSPGGVIIADIFPQGNTAKVLGGGTPNSPMLCIGDKLVTINDQNVAQWTFEQIMDHIASLKDNSPVQLTLERPSHLRVVRFLLDPRHAVAIAAQPGDCIGALAHAVCRYIIDYSCRNGGCGTCQQVLYFGKDADSIRYVRPCVGTVPSNNKGAMTILHPDLYNQLFSG